MVAVEVVVLGAWASGVVWGSLGELMIVSACFIPSAVPVLIVCAGGVDDWKGRDT